MSYDLRRITRELNNLNELSNQIDKMKMELDNPDISIYEYNKEIDRLNALVDEYNTRRELYIKNTIGG